MKPTVNFVFTIGYRCYSPNFLKKYDLRRMSGPFDFLIVDLETALKIINNKFDDYLCDIVSFHKDNQEVQLFYKKNTTEISNKIHELMKNNIGYMADSYNHRTLWFNQNYLDDKLSENQYNWNAICSFHHHDVTDSTIYATMQRRYERFNNILSKYDETTALFYITKIVNCQNIVEYMNNISEIKRKNNIRSFLIIIVNSDNLDDNEYYNELDKCLFVIKRVEDYETQYSKYITDNNLEYEKEFSVISKYFTFDLIEKDNI